MRRIIYTIGDGDEFSLETRMFHIICITIFIAGLLGLGGSVFYYFRLPLFFLNLSVIIGPMSFFLLSRVGRLETLAKGSFIVASYLFLFFFWFYDSGIDGVGFMFFIPVLMWQLIFHKRHPFLWVLLNVLLFGLLLLFSYFYPRSIVNIYSTTYERFFNSGFIYAIVAFVTFVVIQSLLRNYQNEKILVDEKNEELKLKNDELVKSLREVERLNKTKDMLFSVVSHDIRSFAGTIMNFSYLLVEHEQEMTEDNEDIFKNQIYQSSKNLDDLLNNLLSWARIQMNSVHINLHPCKLAVIANVNYSMFKLGYQQKNISMLIDFPDDLEVLADTEMINSIFRNLMSNSLKFIHEGGRLTISAKESEKPGYVDICFSDTGIGMSQEVLRNLREGFVPSSERGTNNEKGTGLGLFIIKQFVEACNGEFMVDSQKEKGTTFTVCLPSA